MHGAVYAVPGLSQKGGEKVHRRLLTRPLRCLAVHWRKRNHTLCEAIVLPSRKAGFRAGFRPDSTQEHRKIGPPAGRRPAGGPILTFSDWNPAAIPPGNRISGPEALLPGTSVVGWHLRYRDDIFVICKSREAANRALAVVQSRAKTCWKVELREFSTYSVSMLDTWVFKGRSCHSTEMVDYSPYVKKTARHVPLDKSSAHAPSIRTARPINEIARMFRRSLHRSHSEYFRCAKIRRFEQCLMLRAILQECKAWRRPVQPSKSPRVIPPPPVGRLPPAPNHPRDRGLGNPPARGIWGAGAPQK